MSELLNKVQPEFLQLTRKVRDRRLVYLDSAATTLKPRAVIDAVTESLAWGAANVHRGAHLLSDEATEKFEAVRAHVARFIGAKQSSEIVFTKGTTEGLNLLASSLGEILIEPGDEILVSQMEHHSNIVPWQMMAKQKGAKVLFVRVTDQGEIDHEHFKSLLSPRTKIVSLVHLSNSLGTVNPLAELFKQARQVGAICVVDAAQSISFMPIDVATLGCHFLVFSGHKIFAPTGVGVLYGELELLNKMPPYQGGGSMIERVSESGTTFLDAPHRFEAGTPPIAEVMGLGASLRFVESIGLEAIASHERTLQVYAAECLRKLGDIEIYGQSADQGPILSFLINGSHPSDVGALLDQQGVAVRAGHHCCQPLMARFGVVGTVRASFSIYSSDEDVDQFVEALRKAKGMLQ